MGACYSVDLKMKVKDEKGAISAARMFIGTESTRFSMDGFREEGVDTDTLDGLVRVVLAGWRKTPFRKEVQKDGFVLYTNDFDASYGWENVMMDFFNAIGSYMEDGSMIYIEPDNDYDEATVRDGLVVWLH